MKRQLLVKSFDDFPQTKLKHFRINPYDNLKKYMSQENYSDFQLLSE